MPAAPPPAQSPHAGLSFTEFVVMMAALMALTALAIDSMLPALPQIAASIGIESPNGRQWIVTAFLLGFGGGQILYGPLADRYGRKPVLLAGLSIYAVFSMVAALSRSFELMMVARVMEGIGAAAGRVLPVSIVRDCYAGRQMARVMSLTSIVFMGVPILAPSVGQLVMLVAPWPFVFLVLAVSCVAVIIWAGLRLPETLHPQDRMPIALGRMVRAVRVILADRAGVGYTLGTSCLLGTIFGFVNSAQQIFTDTFHAPRLFAVIFAISAGSLAVASLVNSRLVVRLGMRLISHAALVGFILISTLHALIALSGHESLILFTLLQSIQMFCFGLVVGNFGAMAMETLGHVAGTAASIQGFVSLICGALVGFCVGQSFDGTVVPLTVGYSLCGLATLLVALVTERGRLFRPHQRTPEDDIEVATNHGF